MQLRNSPSRYGVVSIILHWGVALAVFGLFGLGLWMVGLDYYSPWRKAGPDLHKCIGLVLLAARNLAAARIKWKALMARWSAPSRGAGSTGKPAVGVASEPGASLMSDVSSLST